MPEPEVAIVGSGWSWPSRLAGPVLVTVAFACIATTQLLGPSPAEPPLGAHDNSATPPWHFVAAPPDWLVITLPVAAAIAGAAAIALVLSGRWRPRPARLAIAGVTAAAALSLLPPIGSADHLSYAAYGRITATGHDPYRTSPADLARSTDDPVAVAVEVPWQDTPSVYGPVATAEQAAASAVAGPDVAMTVLLLDLVGAAAFGAAAWLLYRRAESDAARMRAAVLWAANPLLWLELAAGAHIDVLCAAGAIAAVAVAARTRLGAGLLAGAAAAVKVPGGLVWLALVWAWRRRPRDIATLAVGAAAVVVPGYLVAGSGAIDQLSRASRLVSLADPWRLLVTLADPPRRLIGLLAAAAFIALVAVLMRRTARTTFAVSETSAATAVAATLTFAYVLTAPYALPWYDALPWVFVAASIASWRDWALLAHTSVLALSYLNRAATPLHGVLHTLSWGMRTDIAPPVLLAVLVIAAAVAARTARALPDRVGPRPAARR